MSFDLISRFCMIYHLNKPVKAVSEEQPPPPPPQRFDSLGAMTSPSSNNGKGPSLNDVTKFGYFQPLSHFLEIKAM